MVSDRTNLSHAFFAFVIPDGLGSRPSYGFFEFFWFSICFATFLSPELWLLSVVSAAGTCLKLETNGVSKRKQQKGSYLTGRQPRTATQNSAGSQMPRTFPVLA